ncbi:MAG: PAS domain-containing protein, partial [Archangium sp.]
MSPPGNPPCDEQHQLVNLLASHAADALYMMDAQGRVTYANPAAERLLGWSRQEMLGQVLHDLIHDRRPDGTSFPMSECLLGQVMTTGRTLMDHEDVFVHRDGSFLPVSCSNAPVMAEGRIVGAVLVVHDLTARKRAEEARAEQWLQFQLLSDSLPHLAWIARPDGTSEYVNQRWHEYTGLSREESLGYGWLRSIHPEDHAPTLERWQRSLATGEPFETELRMRRASDGAWLWFIARAQPARAADGRIVRWVGSCTDIDDRRRAEQ